MSTHFHAFPPELQSSETPTNFTFPFSYTPHWLSEIATKEIQHHLETQTEWEHNFGLEDDAQEGAIGKMFGVLVVENLNGEIGYLAAFSGKLANSNHHRFFVPPVFDMLKEDGFYRIGEEELNGINREVKRLESDEEYLSLKTTLGELEAKATTEIEEAKAIYKEARKLRRQRKAEAKETLNEEDYITLMKKQSRESQLQQEDIKRITQEWKEKTFTIREKLADYDSQLQALKTERKQKSAALQQQLFEQYTFLNRDRKEKSLQAIFKHDLNIQPPAGAGECAAPKLLQYAFCHQLRPLAMAEFWWGKSPSSQIRKHGNFYPSCRSKCEPILNHMLEGIPLEQKMGAISTPVRKELEIIFEDEHIALINKPHEFLSVPGKDVSDSVLARMQKKYPEATGPLLVHRLDMSTSGLLLMAKTKDAHKNLQEQFAKRTVKKRYKAILEGVVEKNEGLIDLPLRVDLDNRPHQLVCYEYGKPAQTHFEVVERSATHTLVNFYPITGRTHQLRMHAAHQLGLNAPMVGDNLYGQPSDRLYLHAEAIAFEHPANGERMEFELPAEFGLGTPVSNSETQEAVI